VLEEFGFAVRVRDLGYAASISSGAGGGTLRSGKYGTVHMLGGMNTRHLGKQWPRAARSWLLATVLVARSVCFYFWKGGEMIYLISFTMGDPCVYVDAGDDRERAIRCILARCIMVRPDVELALQTIEDRVQITGARFSSRIQPNIMVTVLKGTEL